MVCVCVCVFAFRVGSRTPAHERLLAGLLPHFQGNLVHFCTQEPFHAAVRPVFEFSLELRSTLALAAATLAAILDAQKKTVGASMCQSCFKKAAL